MIKGIFSYFSRLIMSMNPILQVITAFVGSIASIIFPDKALIAAAKAVFVVIVLDLITKYYAKAYQCREGRNIFVGLVNAIKKGELKSATMWYGSVRKVISYLFIMILVGLSYKFGAFQGLASAFSLVAYALMFLRESQSIIENLIDAGHTELKWLLSFIKKRRAILGDDGDDVDNKSKK